MEFGEVILDLTRLNERTENEETSSKRARKKDEEENRPHAKAAICVQITFLCNASLAL